MSVIFSHALNALKANPLLAGQAPAKPSLISKTADNSKSILTRIKRTSGKPNRKIIQRETNQDNKQKEEANQEETQPRVLKITHKLIKKPKQALVIKSRPQAQTNAWAHDLYEGPGPSLTNPYHTVFIRNLPEVIDSEALKRNINEKSREFVMGIKIEKDTAEINFSMEDAAKLASEGLNGKSIAGKKIKAALMSDINPKNVVGTGIRKKVRLGKMEVEREGKENVERPLSRMSIDEEDKRKSIVERIKKNK